MIVFSEGDVFDETGISEDLLDEGDDVLNVSYIHSNVGQGAHKQYNLNSFHVGIFQDDELEEETLLNASAHDEDAILKSPQGSTTSKSPDNLASTAPASQQQKKVILKRKLITTISVNDNDDTKSETASPSTEASASKCAKLDEDDADATNGSGGDKTVVKLTELTMKERLELRAKKFGAAPSVDALKQARAERFGIPADAKTDGKKDDSTGKIASAPVSVDVLKKRAERFGGSVSTVMNKIENKEKLQKRQERFGAGTTNTNATAAAIATADVASEYAEKAKLRLERFKTSVK